MCFSIGNLDGWELAAVKKLTSPLAGPRAASALHPRRRPEDRSRIVGDTSKKSADAEIEGGNGSVARKNEAAHAADATRVGG